jgi:hypothetical protein
MLLIVLVEMALPAVLVRPNQAICTVLSNY